MNTSDIVADVENSFLDNLDTLPESGTNGKFERTSEIGNFSESVETVETVETVEDSAPSEIPRHLLWDESGNERADADGNTFDLSLHSVDDNGHPKLTAKGKLRKKRGRKGASTLSSSTASNKVAQVAISEKAKFQAVGAGAANALICLGLAIGGEDFAPIRNADMDEKSNLEKAFADWAETQEVEDIPPNLALTIVVGSYLFPRLVMPRQVTKFQMLKQWLKLKFFKKPTAAKVFDPNKEEN
ncbi:coil containing protein [Vibrio phage 1.125.O._10N.286.49.F5]|uniref:Coil containing protein n=1 Tax=Vibrio phage 1.125.O._10N.286.49.F5 TaxID=1881427 RepID=A0A2I7R7E7_9VIRU|nr:coil containing protein [Vibrio phage 1.125.O._10N.286.49.F5]